MIFEVIERVVAFIKLHYSLNHFYSILLKYVSDEISIFQPQKYLKIMANNQWILKLRLLSLIDLKTNKLLIIKLLFLPMIIANQANINQN